MSTQESVWLDRALVEIFHQLQIRTHGGSFGLRDESVLDSALARPQQRFHYDPDADLQSLAASLGFGLARNHPFVDGNKRTAFLAMYAFLGYNGLKLEIDESEVVAVILDLASGELSEEDLARWLRLRCVKR